MELITDTTLSDQDISAPLLVLTHTATVARQLAIHVYLSGVAGDGVYRATYTKQIGGAGSAYVQAVVATDAATGDTAVMLPVLAPVVEIDDVVKVYVQGLVGDTAVGAVIQVHDVTPVVDEPEPLLIVPPPQQLVGSLALGMEKGLAIAGSESYLLQSLLAGLVSYWKFEEASGTRVDSHGVEDLADTGTVTRETGKNGYGISNDTTAGRYLSRSADHILDIGQFDFTFNFWIKLKSTGADFTIASQRDDADLCWELWYTSGDWDGVYWAIGDGDGSTAIGSTFAGGLSADTWYMITVDFDAENLEVGVRKDGGTRYTQGCSGAPANNEDVGIRLLARSGSTPRWANCVLDSVARWNRLLTDEEAVALYNAGSPPEYPWLSSDPLYETVDDDDGYGQDIRLLVSNNTPVSGSYPLVIYFHDHGDDETEVGDTADARIGVIRALLAHGYIVASTNAHSDSGADAWGNDDCLADYEHLYDYCTGEYNISRVMALAEGTGGIAGLLSVAGGAIPFTGWCGIAPACDLDDMATLDWLSEIETAYGITYPPSWETATAGHNPVALDGDLFPLRMRFYASNSDVPIDRPSNTDVMHDVVAAYAIEHEVVACTGTHDDPSHFDPLDVVAFFERCV
jgi:hypothetical protein